VEDNHIVLKKKAIRAIMGSGKTLTAAVMWLSFMGMRYILFDPNACELV